MKHLSYFLLLLLLGLPLLSACSDDSDTTPGADLPVPFAPLPANTLAGNQLNRGQATADADHLYYWTADTPTSIVLCSRHKETGMVIYLDHIEQAHEGVDFMFTNLHARDGYLYYYAFDPKNDRKGFFRTKADGSTGPERLTDVEWYHVIYADDCFYLYNMLSQEIREISYDGSSVRTLFYKNTFFTPTLHEGRFYYIDYEDEGDDFHPVLRTCDLAGGDDRKIHDFRQLSLFLIDDDCIYLFDTDPTVPDQTPRPYFDGALSSIPLQGGEETILVKDMPMATRINLYKDYLFLCSSDTNVPLKNGLYVYKKGEARASQIVSGRPVSLVNVTGDNQLVFSDNTVTVSRMGKLYLTDFAGANITELT